VSGLPVGWVESSIGEVTKPFESIDPGRSPERWVDYIDIGSIDNTTQRIADPKRVLGREAPSRARRLVETGDVLFSTVRTYLKNIARVPPELDGALTSTGIALLRPSEALESSYLFHWVCSAPFLETISKAQDGTMYPAVSDRDVSAASIVLPPLAEQRRIVAKLDALTARTVRARADLDRIPTLAARYKQAVLAKAFSGELTAEWRSSRGLPEPRMTRLADLVAEPLRNGLSVRGSDEPPGVRSLRLSALRGGAVNLEDVRFLPISDDHARRFLLRDGDILVSRGNGTKTLVGISALVGHVRETTIFPDTAFRVRVAQDRVDPQWLSHIWSAPQSRTQIEAVAKTTAGIWKVSQADLAGVELPFFELSEQIEMVGRLGHALAEIDRMAAEAVAARRLLDRLDQAVLSKAFRGELVPQDPADEPASILLDRIRAERAGAPKGTRGRRKAVA